MRRRGSRSLPNKGEGGENTMDALKISAPLATNRESHPPLTLDRNPLNQQTRPHQIFDMSASPTRHDHLKAEGDLNLSPHRAAWSAAQLDADTRHWLEEDARYFLHQSLSTPCLNVLKGCAGASVEDRQGRRLLDFHGNNVHQVGFGHPRVIEAITAQMEELSFCTRRYTNIPAIQLARKLTELAPGNLKRVLFAP